MKEESKDETIEKLKLIGRIGPQETKLDLKRASGKIRLFNNGLMAEASQDYSSIKANCAVINGAWMLEVELLSLGPVIIGWC